MSETAQYSGMPRVPLIKNWWFANDFEEQLPDWYEPTWPHWRRELCWTYLRNSLQNLRAVVLGVQDKNYTVTGRAPVWTVQRNDLIPPEAGWQWHVLYGGDLWPPSEL